VNCVALQKCAAMANRSYCQHCRCSWSVHMHITYECTQVQTQVVDANVEKQIKDKASKIKISEQHLQSLQDRINKLEAEKQALAKVSAQFGCFLKHNAIAAYNDATFDYLEHLIEVHRGIVGADGDKSILKGLEKLKSMYEEEVQILEQAISSQKESAHVPTGEEINQLYDDLCRLDITGPMLMKAMKVAEATDVVAMQRNEERIQPYRKPPNSGNKTMNNDDSAVSSQPRRDRFQILGHVRGWVKRKITGEDIGGQRATVLPKTLELGP